VLAYPGCPRKKVVKQMSCKVVVVVYCTSQPMLAGTQSWRVLLEQSFTAHMPVLTTTSAFSLWRRCQSPHQQCYLQHLEIIPTTTTNVSIRDRTSLGSIWKVFVCPKQDGFGTSWTFLYCLTYLHCYLNCCAIYSPVRRVSTLSYKVSRCGLSGFSFSTLLEQNFSA